MAPTAPSKRRSMRAKLAAKSNGPQPYAPRKAPRPDAVEASDSFISSKKDKRIIKHASLVSRIEKAHKKPLKRRRPGKKLVTDLDSLRKALPDLGDGETEESLRQLREGKVRLKSLRSRKGALKKKEKVVRGEVERFRGSLARLNAVGAAATAATQCEGQAMDVETTSTHDAADGVGGEGETQAPAQNTTARWAALRSFISATMEQSPAFMKKDGKE